MASATTLAWLLLDSISAGNVLSKICCPRDNSADCRQAPQRASHCLGEVRGRLTAVKICRAVQAVPALPFLPVEHIAQPLQVSRDDLGRLRMYARIDVRTQMAARSAQDPYFLGPCVSSNSTDPFSSGADRIFPQQSEKRPAETGFRNECVISKTVLPMDSVCTAWHENTFAISEGL